ncbi:hypothetical protein [Hyphomonas sp.]|uniref:hypothetical protein n=1 Tax=Hyphomonas sp. TaxID=87 RepID=UPI0025B7AFEF|nr:hypothetical protein [Hyphomonas sp.]
MISISPMQWARLKDIHEVDPINGEDSACMLELYEVLKKHGRQDRFGIAMLHKHFDVADDEVLVETTDVEGRMLTIEPMKASEAKGFIETIWKLDEAGVHAQGVCVTFCKPDDRGFHVGPIHTGRQR